jgi:uncharacterized Rmd1/YagE family protein
MTTLNDDMIMNHKADAYHLGQRIKLKSVCDKFKYEIIKSEHSFLLFKLDEQSFCYIKDYGSIVFINITEELSKYIIELILDRTISIDEFPCENYVLEENINKEFNVGFSSISIPEFTLDMAHIVMLNLGQSVALDNYFEMSFSLLEQIKIYANQIENTGSINLTRKKVKKFIGKTMNLKNSIAENLFIFETSNLAWTDKDLAKLDNQMREELEILLRHNGLQNNLNVISENLDFFKDILQHKHSSTLEWIIILLILFEIVQVLFEKIF